MYFRRFFQVTSIARLYFKVQNFIKPFDFLLLITIMVDINLVMCMQYIIIVHIFIFQARPIILASSKGHIKCVKTLLNHQNVDISMANIAGYNCLAEAIRNGHK